jgi:hypothetical protein
MRRRHFHVSSRRGLRFRIELEVHAELVKLVLRITGVTRRVPNLDVIRGIAPASPPESWL